MNVASKDLCQQLFKLSGWGYTDSSYQDTGTDQFENYEHVGETFNTKDNGSTGFPAYDLGYLLRKLKAIDDPDLPERKSNIYVELTVMDNYADATAVRGITETGIDQRAQRRLPSCDANTPEDAACKLAIKLFKQGILK